MVTVFSTFMLLSGCPDVSGVWGESSLQATVEKNSGRVKIYFSFIVLDGLKIVADNPSKLSATEYKDLLNV